VRIVKRFIVAPTERKSLLGACSSLSEKRRCLSSGLTLAPCLYLLTVRYFGGFSLRLDALHMQRAPFAEWSQCIRERVTERRECILNAWRDFPKIPSRHGGRQALLSGAPPPLRGPSRRPETSSLCTGCRRVSLTSLLH
jgi:hypothetical protein